MSWFKQWPKKGNGFRAKPTISDKQQTLIMTDHYVYNIVWCDKLEQFVLWKGRNLREIQWNHTET